MAASLEVEGRSDSDYVEYFLFPHLPSELSEKERLDKLQELCLKYNAAVAKYVAEYLWHKETFALQCRAGTSQPQRPPRRKDTANGSYQENDLPPHLYGFTHFGDNIEDEWFIVYLLVQLTKSEPGLIVRVIDSDEEFLLIEAADHLPKWADPETCEGRVYLRNGLVHLIPNSIQQDSPSVCKALSIIRKNNFDTAANENIQAAIAKRIEKFPSQIRESYHRAHAFIPARAAAILRARPSLVADAVHAFYTRDPVDLKVCQAMRQFAPETCVMTDVLFTRCLYAMLVQQKYNPPKGTGWHFPPVNSPAYKAHEIGMKLACGLEILAATSQPGADSTVPVSLEHLKSDVKWNKYLGNLKSNGYFQNLLEGSKKHKELLGKAQQHFVDNMLHTGKKNPSSHVAELLETLDVNFEELQKRATKLPSADDDSWLDMSEQKFDSVLASAFGLSSNSPNDIAKSFKYFLEQTSGLDGVEVPEKTPTRPPRKKSKSNTNSTRKSSADIDFDAEKFSQAMEKILDFSIPEDKWETESDMSSSYGESDEDDPFVKSNIPKDLDMEKYMKQMDQELAGTTIAQSDPSIVKSPVKSDTDDFEDVEDFQPVNVDTAVIKNMLESYRSQHGLPGPASNILGLMGVNIDQMTNNL